MLAKVIVYIVNPLIYLLVAVAVVVFLWGVVEFLANAENPEGRENGKRHLVWGIVGLFIIFSVFGIMNLIQGTLLSLVK